MKVRPISADAAKDAPDSASSLSSESISFKLRTLPVLSLSDLEVAAYDTNPANQPKLDFKPKSNGKKAQPSEYIKKFSP